MKELDTSEQLIPEYEFPGPAPVMKPLAQIEDAMIKAEISLVLARNAEKTGHARGISETNAEALLQWVVGYTRDKLAGSFGSEKKFRQAHSDLTGLCAPSQSVAAYALEKLGLKRLQQHSYSFYSGDRLSHTFIVATIPVAQKDGTVTDTPYLIDTTYRQFFEPADPKVRRPGQPDLYKAGFVVTRTPEGQALANTLLKQGYVKLDEHKAALYLGSFANGKKPESSALEKICDASLDIGYKFPPEVMEREGADAISPLSRLLGERTKPAETKRTP